MAYSDRRGIEFSPASLAATALINGSILFGIASIAPEATREVVLNLIAYPVKTEKEVIPPPPPEKAKPAPKKIVIADRPPNETVTPPLAAIDSLIDEPPMAGNGGDALVKRIPEQPVAPVVLPPVIIGPRPDPRFAARLQPEYPSSAVREGLSGIVKVKVLVGVDGRVKDVVALAFPGDSLLKATRDQAFKYWRFLPATRDGVAIEEWREMTVRFILPE